MPRYVFSEFTPLSELTSKATLKLLAEHELLTYVAFTPKLAPSVVDVASKFRDAGVSFGLWPLLANEMGRWANDWNANEFADHCRSLLDRLSSAQLWPDELLLDLEPPIGVTKHALRGRFSLRRKARVGALPLVRLVSDAKRESRPVVGAVAPWAAVGEGSLGWQRIMGTPIDELELDRVFLMAYTSLIEGYSRGILARPHAEALLAEWTSRAVEKFGSAAAVAVGVVGVGALGDECPYRDPQQLARDIALSRGAGCEHLALFNLQGLLRRDDSMSWWRAYASSPMVEPLTASKRVRALLFSIDEVGRLALRFRRSIARSAGRID